jgi:hypothetical protein
VAATVLGAPGERRSRPGRYLGAEAAEGMLAAVDQPGTVQARICVRPDWVGLLDFVTRRPSVQGGV